MNPSPQTNALLFFRVGPVLCCAPSQPVMAIITPPKLTHPPGSNQAQPGIFKHAGCLVTGRDLRVLFGVDEQDRSAHPKMIITTLDDKRIGFLVDEIREVSNTPSQGWGSLPSLLPRGIFSRTLLQNESIHLYVEFSKLATLLTAGYLRHYIVHLQDIRQQQTGQNEPVTKTHQPDHSTQTKNVSSLVVPPTSSESGLRSHDTSPVGTHGTLPSPTKSAPQKHAPPPHIKSSTEAVTTQAGLNKPAPRVQSSKTQPGKVATPSQQTQHAVKPLTLPSVTPGHAVNTAFVFKPTESRSTTGTPHTTNNKQNASFGIILIALLCLVGTSTFIWYGLRQPAPVLPAPSSTISNTTPYAPAAVTAPVPEPVPPPVATLPNATPPAMPDTSSSESQTKHQTGYQATITQDQQGVTIVLETPVEEAVFTSAPLQMSGTSSAAVDKVPPTATPEPQATLGQPAEQPSEVLHIVVKGDTLWHIAKRYVNNPYRYPELAKLSDIKNPDLIYPGNRVRIIKKPVHKSVPTQ